MNNNDELLAKLKKSTALEVRITWEELEEEPRALLDFCKFAKDVDALSAIKLCPLLSLTTAKPCIELLIHYCQHSDNELSDKAFESLHKVDGHNAKRYIITLLNETKPQQCIKALELLCHYGLSFDIVHIRRLLAAETVELIEATLLSLNKLNFKRAERMGIADLLLNSLQHPTHTIRSLAAEQMRSLPLSSSALQHILEMLQREEDSSVRCQICGIFGEHFLKEAEQPLLAILNDDEAEATMRKAAAESLANYPSTTIADGIVDAMTRNLTPELRRTCIQSLGSMPEEILLKSSERAMQSGERVTRIVGFELAGLLALPESEASFCNCWRKEKDDAVIISIIEVAGRAGFTTAWDLIYAELEKDELTAYTAIQALAAILTVDHISEFSAILEQEHENSIHEGVLSRLELWATDYPLPSNIALSIQHKLQHPYLNVSILAAKVSAYIKDTSLSLALLELLKPTTAPELTRVVSHSLLEQHDGSLHSILCNYPEQRQCFKLLIKEAPEICAEAQTIVYLATEAYHGPNWATTALTELAKRDLEPFCTILATSNEDYNMSLIDAWILSDFYQRIKHPLPLKHLLSVPQARVRMSALLRPPHIITSDILAHIIQCSLVDKNNDVRELARTIVTDNFIQAQEEE